MDKFFVQKPIVDTAPRLFQQTCDALNHEPLEWGDQELRWGKRRGKAVWTELTVTPDGDEPFTITPATFHKAVTAAMQIGAMSYDLQRDLMHCMIGGGDEEETDDEEGEGADAVDRELADALVQFYIFDEIVFG